MHLAEGIRFYAAHIAQGRSDNCFITNWQLAWPLMPSHDFFSISIKTSLLVLLHFSDVWSALIGVEMCMRTKDHSNPYL